jgi:plastocyanin
MGLGSGGDAQADQGALFTIEISAQGFNPETCTVNRNGSTVRFHNLDSVAHHVVVPDPSNPTDLTHPLFDFGVIEPGAYSRSAIFNQLDDWKYRDADNANMTGEIIVPLSNGTVSQCSPLTPTPTPTNTPIPTATPTLTPSPTPTPPPARPGGCDRFLAHPEGCAVAPELAADGQPDAAP